MTSTITKGQEVATDVAALLRSRNPLIWVVTREEARVERLLVEAAKAAGYLPRTWDVAAGICDLTGKPARDVTKGADTNSPDAAFATIDGVAFNRDPQRGDW